MDQDTACNQHHIETEPGGYQLRLVNMRPWQLLLHTHNLQARYKVNGKKQKNIGLIELECQMNVR